MSSLQLTQGIGASISIEGRSYTKTNSEPVVFIPAYKTIEGKVWHYWAVLGRSKSAVAGTVNTSQYTAEYNLVINSRNVYVLTLDNGAFENGTLSISGPGVASASIQTGAPGQWCDLSSMTPDNLALREAESVLYEFEKKGKGLMSAGGVITKEYMEGIQSAGFQGIMHSGKTSQPVDIYNGDISGKYLRAVSTLANGSWGTVVTAIEDCKVEIQYVVRYEHVVKTTGVKAYKKGDTIYNTKSDPLGWSIAIIVQ